MSNNGDQSNDMIDFSGDTDQNQKKKNQSQKKKKKNDEWDCFLNTKGHETLLDEKGENMCFL
jgi:hypothetical protein